jgi:hypothetical protein
LRASGAVVADGFIDTENKSRFGSTASRETVRLSFDPDLASIDKS